MTLRERMANSGFAIKSEDVKSKLLSRSLLWMGMGLAMIVLVAYLTSTVEVFYNIMYKITMAPWLIMLLLNFGLFFGMFMTIRNPKIHIAIPASLYAIFSIYEGFFISASFFYAGIYNIGEMMLIMLIPAGIFLVMGMLAYSNFINFTKLIPFVLFAMLGLLIMSIVLIFVDSIAFQKWYLLIAAGIFIIWIGIDIQMIKNSENSLLMYGSNLDKSAMNRIAFMFGISLFVDFINLLMILIRFIGLTRD